LCPFNITTCESTPLKLKPHLIGLPHSRRPIIRDIRRYTTKDRLRQCTVHGYGSYNVNESTKYAIQCKLCFPVSQLSMMNISIIQDTTLCPYVRHLLTLFRRVVIDPGTSFQFFPGGRGKILTDFLRGGQNMKKTNFFLCAKTQKNNFFLCTTTVQCVHVMTSVITCTHCTVT